jgi:hypothetical protein
MMSVVARDDREGSVTIDPPPKWSVSEADHDRYTYPPFAPFEQGKGKGPDNVCAVCFVIYN